MINITNYTIYSEKINHPKRIALCSDLHYGFSFKKEKLEQILNNLQMHHPDYICIPGDLVDDLSVIEDQERQTEYLSFFEKLGQIAPTIISLGNHDFIKKIPRNKRTDHKKYKYVYDTNWIDRLNHIENVHILEDTSYKTEEIIFYGCTYNLKSYHNHKKGENETTIKKNITSCIKESSRNKYNILLFHSPISIAKEEVLRKIPYIDKISLILCGHMHSGLLHPLLGKHIKGNKGLISPEKTLFPDNARGKKEYQIKMKILTLIISGSITKIHAKVYKPFQLLNNLYPMDIEYIDVKPKNS